MVTQGIHILSGGREPISADVVFVHGLRGDAFETWSADKVCWPRDLLPQDLDNARIMTWRFDSIVAKPGDLASQLSIFGHAENLLGDLAGKRRKKEEKTRPIVLVGYSLGGLVIKSALIRSSEYLNNRQNPTRGAIYSCTAGAVFLGTPHRGGGSPGLSLAHFFVKAAKAAFHQPNANLVGNLDQASEFLEQQRRSFSSISERMPAVCFFEEMPVPLFGMIVPEHSACIDGFRVTSRSLPANHMDMCKYANNDTLGYQRVSEEIISLVGEAAENILSGQHIVDDESLINNERDRACLHALFVTDPKDDIANIQDTKHQMQAGTCSWISTDPIYDMWFHEHLSGILWLHGDAGKGKTTHAIRQVTELRNRITNSTAILLYFFCDAKDNRRNNGVVILRGLLYQLICQRPDLIKPLREEYEKQKDQLFSSPNALQSLWRILEDVLRQCSGMTTWLVIDALDECEPQSREIFLKRIKSRVNYQRDGAGGNTTTREKWFLTSRNETAIRERLNDTADINLETQSHQVAADVEKFIEARVQELQEVKTYRDDLTIYIRQILSEKAEGTFLWVSLACAELRKVPTIRAKKVLETLPSGLNAIYERILHQVLQNGEEDLARYAQDILISVLTAFRPFRLTELAVMADLPKEHLGDPDLILEYVEQCGSFLTIRKQEVHLVHQSAKDYLSSAPALKISANLEEEHEILALRCLEYICSGFFDDGLIDLIYRDADYSIKERLKTLIEYPVSFWMEHGKLASPDFVNCIDQENQLFHRDTRHRDAWFDTYWRLTGFWLSAPRRTSPMHLAACSGIESLVMTIAHWDTEINMKDTCGRTPLLLAAEQGHNEVVRYLLSVKGIDPNCTNKYGDTPLSLAATEGHEEIVTELLSVKGIIPNRADLSGATPLTWAAISGHDGIVKQLLAIKDVHPNCKDIARRTPLSYAAQNGHEGVVQQLMHRGVDPDCKDTSGQTPLSHAVESGHEKVMQQLILEGVDPNCKDSSGQTPLFYAARNGHDEIVQQLHLSGADLDCKDASGRTALSYSAEKGLEKVVRQLILGGADPKCKDGFGRTQLSFAVKYGHEKVAQQLLLRGADPQQGFWPFARMVSQ